MKSNNILPEIIIDVFFYHNETRVTHDSNHPIS